MSTAFALGVALAACQPTSSTREPELERMCATDVRQCPDGSTVERTGPDCTFAPCPGDRVGVPMGDDFDDDDVIPPMEPMPPDDEMPPDEAMPPDEWPSEPTPPETAPPPEPPPSSPMGEGPPPEP